MTNDYSEAHPAGQVIKRAWKKLQETERAHLKKEEHGARIWFR